MDSPAGVLLSLALTARIPLGFASWVIVIVICACRDSPGIRRPGYCYRYL